MATASFQSVSICARVVVDPEIRQMKASKATVCAFTIELVTLKRFSGKVEEVRSKLICESFGKLGDICAKMVQKGAVVLVSGHLEEDRWEDPTYNRHRSQIKLILESIRFPQRSSMDENQEFVHLNGPGVVEDPRMVSEAPGLRGAIERVIEMLRGIADSIKQ